ncbi:MAG: DUF4330 family protein [Clostridiales bacterium]|nr:DUF4330 family protein [Clostridiales bacterium]
MKLSKIFKDKKLFGKLNIIDLLIIILVIVVAIIAYAFLKGDTPSLTTSTQNEYNFTIQIQKSEKNIFDKINIGDKIYDNENNSYLGEVVSKEKNEYRELVDDYKNNKKVYATNDKYININITVKNNLQDKGNNLVTNEEYKVKVGKQVAIRGNNYAGKGYIILIER